VKDVRTLTEDKTRTWQAFMQMQEQLSSRLEQQLQASSKLSNPDYTVLVVLSEAPGHRLRVYELLRIIGWEKSRLHHQLSRMCQRGLVRREPDPVTPRAMHAVLTDAGLAAITAAAPAHAREVQRLFFDYVTDEQVDQLAAISHRVLAGLMPTDQPPPDCSGE
jgi:DNA-binding MarR family transcriptional regulator